MTQPNQDQRPQFQFHGERNKLLAEAHARPYTPLPSPTLGTRIANLSTADADLAHMTALCRQLDVPEPGPNSRWCAIDAGGTAQVFTDFRPGPDLFTRIQIIQAQPDANNAGRLVQRLFEIETYRLLAMLAFPLTEPAGKLLARLEEEAAAAALEVCKTGSVEADRALLNRLAGMAGEAQALLGRTSFRFSAARAYYGLVQERVEQLRETRLEGRPTLAEFMERRLAPAMRTCTAVAERLQGVIAHISTTSQLLNTRVDVAAEANNERLLASMERRARLQLRLQQTVEGLSVAAISYYALGLLSYIFKAGEVVWKHFDPALATGLSAPLVIGLVWRTLHRVRLKMLSDDRH